MNFKLLVIFLVALFAVATNAFPKRPSKHQSKQTPEDEPESLSDIYKSKFLFFNNTGIIQFFITSIFN